MQDLAPFHYKESFSRFWISNKDKTVVRQCYLYNGNPYIGKTTSLYWNTLPLVILNYATTDNTDQLKAHDDVIKYQMETFSAMLAICAGNSPVTGEFPAQRPVTRSFDVFFGLSLNKRLSKQSRHCAHYDVTVMKRDISNFSLCIVCCRSRSN